VAAVALIALALSACGSSDRDETGSQRPVTTETFAPAQPLTRAKRAKIESAVGEVDHYCRQVARYFAGERGEPSLAELNEALAAIDRIGAVARRQPYAQLRPGVDVRLALGDLAENLEGSNCSPELVARADQALAASP
jgi:hypothetical protein